MFIHLGDGQREVDEILELFPNLNLVSVRGNCDFGSFKPETTVVSAGDIRILCTHGHSLSVKYSLESLKELAKEENCRIALYGHTHESVTDYDDGLYVMNPGSARVGEYGAIDITPSGIMLLKMKL